MKQRRRASAQTADPIDGDDSATSPPASEAEAVRGGGDSTSDDAQLPAGEALTQPPPG